MTESRPQEPVEVIRAPALAGLPHGFLGRRGGVSEGIVAGLNVGLGADDDLHAVRENRARAAAAVCPDARLVTVYQVHSADVAVVADVWPEDSRPRADAMVTNRPGVLLGIVTADCAPILLADRDAGVVGAAHAGWRGAHSGVAEAAVEAMLALGARRARIVAAIGPCIGQASYEVGADFRGNFPPEQADLFAPGRPDHWQFDLETYVARRLESAGIGLIEPLGLDTYPDPDRFFSYRRSVHREEPNYGRQFSLIGLPPRS